MYMSCDVRFCEEFFFLNLQFKEDYSAKSSVKLFNYFSGPLVVSLDNVDSFMSVLAQDEFVDPIMQVPA